MNNNDGIRQAKYSNNSFQSNLNVSQVLVHDIGWHLKHHGLFVRTEDDTVAFVNEDGRKMRLCDIQAINQKKMEMIYIEAKDHCRCWCYDVTGQPQRYIDEKLKLLNGGKRVFIIFRENKEWIAKKALVNRVSEDVILNGLINSGFARKNNDGSIYFIPYGHNLDFLLKENNIQRGLEDKVRSRLENYVGEKQYLWNVSIMLPIDKLIKTQIL